MAHPATTTTKHQSSLHIPWPYILFFLYLEPISALAGAYYAHFQPALYLHLLHFPSLPEPSSTNALTSPPPTTIITLTQLANLYLLFALNEAFVLRAARHAGTPAATTLRVWRALLAGLLVADFGHLASVWCFVGEGVYGRFWEWNAMGWGGVGVVYLGAGLRLAFLCGIGVGAGEDLGKVQ